MQTQRERREHVVTIARFVVIPNDARAYRHAGAWGVYDPNTCQWINFRDSESEAYELCAALASLDREYTEEEYDAMYLAGEIDER